jgi:beta-glucosidase
MKKYIAVLLFFLLLGIRFQAVTGAGGPARLTASFTDSRTKNLSTPAGYTLIFPQTANGAGGGVVYRSRVILINNAGQDASGTIQFYGNDGTFMTLGTSLGRGSSLAFSLNSGQALRVETDGSGDLVTGWTRVTSDTPLSGAGTFTVTDGSGNFLSEVGIGDSKPASRLMIFEDTTQDRNTAFAVCNPDPTLGANLQFELRSLNGATVLASRTIFLGPLAHQAEYVTETFSQIDMRNFRGALIVSGDLPFSLIALRSRGVNFTSLPSVPAPAAGQTAEDLVFPRVGDGLYGDSRYQTTFLLLNNSDADQTASLELFKDDGSAMPVTISGTAAGRFAVTVPAHGAAELVTDGQSDPGVVGWARVTSKNPLGGGATFSIADKSTGDFVSEVGVAGSDLTSKRIAYVHEVQGSFTGLAMSNPSDEEIVVRLRLYAAPGASPSPVAERTVTLPAHGGTGRFVYELFPEVPGIAANSFEGSLEVTTWIRRFGEDILSPVAGLTLLGHGPKFSSLPTAPQQIISHTLASFDPRVDELLKQMTLDEKIGQMTQAERGNLSPGDIETYFLGSVLSGGGSVPAENTVAGWADMIDDFQSQAMKTRLKIPLLYGVDAVHGHSNVWGAVIFPHNIGLGATRNPGLVSMAARATASEVRATGINWTFSPVVAVPQDERWGRTYEGFSEDPSLVRLLGNEAVFGYEGSNLSDPSSIVACAKHYMGDGGTKWGTGNPPLPIDQGDTQVDEATLRRIHLPGYLGALDAGIGTIMISFSSWNGVKMTGNHYLLTDVLKGELGFEGFLVSDWGAIDQLPGRTYGEQVKLAVNAGMDMGMIPYKHQQFFSTLKSLVQSGDVPISQIDDAVRRILRVKFALGLFDRSPLTDRSYQARFGSQEHREVAREAVRQSLVLLKNYRGLLPLPKSLQRIFVAGANADDIGHQCGGWTITWQGGTGNITPGTSVLQAIRQSVSPATEVRFSPDGTNAAGADVAIVVIGENPYAEGWGGDTANLDLYPRDFAAISNVKAAHVPMVVILISGRPMILGTALDDADAFVAAWLPGTEGQGVADVIFGDYSPTGKLPCSWPRSNSQIPINIGDPNYDPLFPYGFGLTYN